MSARRAGGAPLWARVLGTTLLVVYPLFVYLGLTKWGTRVVGLALLGLLVPGTLLRGWAAPSGFWTAIRPLVPAAALIGFAIAIDDARLILVLPVLISVVLLAGFGSTLRAGRMPMVERFARMQDPDLPEDRVPHCRTVTKVWCGFFVVNGTVAGGLALAAPVSWWALYTGAIAYGLMGMIFAGEYVVRRARFRP